jgi:hypothetical protein
MDDYARHSRALDEFVEAVEGWKTAKERGRGKEAEEAALLSLDAASDALQVANVRFHLYPTSTMREVNDVREAVWVFRDTFSPPFDQMLAQLYVAQGRLRKLDEEDAARRAAEEMRLPPNPVKRAWRWFDALALGWRALSASAPSPPVSRP